MQTLKHWDLVKDTLGFKLSFRPQIGAFVPHTISVVSVAILQAIEMLGISFKGQQTSSERLDSNYCRLHGHGLCFSCSALLMWHWRGRRKSGNGGGGCVPVTLWMLRISYNFTGCEILFFWFFSQLVFKNVKSILGTLVLHKQVVDEIWPVDRSWPAPGLNHDMDRLHFSISGSDQASPHPHSCLYLHNSVFSEISSNSAELPWGWVDLRSVWWGWGPGGVNGSSKVANPINKGVWTY